MTYLKLLKENPRYEKLCLLIICLEELEDAFNLIINL